MKVVCPSCGFNFQHDAPAGQLWRCKQCRELFRVSQLSDSQTAESKDYWLPSDVTCKEFGKIHVCETTKATEVFFTILMEPQGAEAEGWQTGIALDGSVSMRMAYHRDAVQPLARRMTEYLASNLDEDGGTTVIYWACGQNGRDIEVLGDLTSDDCPHASFAGPRSFGAGTHLSPAVRYFVDRFEKAKRGMYVFITDGQIHDLEDVKKATIDLARKIQAGKRNPVKCVLIGVGNEVDESQMEELDDLETGTDIDIWDCKIAKEMRALIEIFAEVVSENTIVAPTATIYDEKGQEVAKFSDGLPAKVKFKMPPSSKAFQLEVAGRRIRQTLLSRQPI